MKNGLNKYVKAFKNVADSINMLNTDFATSCGYGRC